MEVQGSGLEPYHSHPVPFIFRIASGDLLIPPPPHLRRRRRKAPLKESDTVFYHVINHLPMSHRCIVGLLPIGYRLLVVASGMAFSTTSAAAVDLTTHSSQSIIAITIMLKVLPRFSLSSLSLYSLLFL